MKLRTISALRTVLMLCGFALTLAACGQEKPQSTVSRGLDSGVTSSNGGGMQPGNFGTLTTAHPQ